jgi:hypothetical protein
MRCTKNRLSFLILILLFFGSVYFLFPDSVLLAQEYKGGLRGSVKYLKNVPVPKIIPIKIDSSICGSEFLQETSVNTENKGISNAIVSLKKKPGQANSDILKSDWRLVTSKKCNFEPSVVGISTNTNIVIANSDPILHVLQFTQKDRLLFNLPLPPQKKIVKKIEKTGLIHVKCVIHPFMDGYIAVLDTPLYSLSDSNGHFYFSDIEPGKYLLSIWHRGFEAVIKDIDIPPGKTLEQNFNLELQ